MAKQINVETMQKWIEENTVEGKTDFTKLTETVNGIIDSGKPDMDKLKAEARDSATNDFISGLSIEGVDSVDKFKVWTDTMRGSNDETKQKLTKAEVELTSYKTQVEELSPFKNQVTNLQREMKLTESGIKDPILRSGLMSTVGNMVNEETDFNSAFDTFKADEKNAHYFSDEKQKGINLLGDNKGSPAGNTDSETERYRREAGLK